jgi:hypothetical protein
MATKKVEQQIFPPSLLLLLLDPVSGINIRIHITAYDIHLAEKFSRSRQIFLQFFRRILFLVGGFTFFR